MWGVAALLVLPAGAVTAAKGRLGWLAVGLLTSGLLSLLTAWLIATPDSPWARRIYGAPKMRRAMAAFPRRLPHERSTALRSAR